MNTANTTNRTPAKGKNRPDCLVIGAGIFGLWAARHALMAGEHVTVVDKRRVGAGASGGFLGALMPHMPDRWNAKKQMQYEALVSLPGTIAALKEDTGRDCGYRCCGRLMPLRHERSLDHVAERVIGAKQHWTDAAGIQAFTMETVDLRDLAKPQFGGVDGEPWLSPDIARYGALFDTLSARVNPRAYLGALAAYARRHGALREGVEVVSVDPKNTEAMLADGTVFAAGRIVIANGWEAYELLGRVHARAGGQAVTGRGVKGQAVLLDLPHADTAPIVYDSGSYIVPHGTAMGKSGDGRPNRIAIGSTSVDDWQGLHDLEAAVTDFDPDDTEFIARAIALAPGLAGAQVTERWANVRPRNTMRDKVTRKVGADPLFAALDGAERVSVAVGGFKIGFGIAHHVTAMNA